MNFVLKELKGKIILLFSMITYLISGLTAMICTRAELSYLGLVISVLFTLTALILHVIACKNHPLLHIVSTCLNALSIGFAIGAYYSIKDICLHSITPVILIVPFFVLSYLICLIYSKEETKASKVILVLFLILLCGLSIAFWHVSDIASYSGFLSVILLFYVVLCQKSMHAPRNILKDISFYSFFIYMIVTCIVITLITDGDTLDIFSDFFDFKHKKKHH